MFPLAETAVIGAHTINAQNMRLEHGRFISSQLKLGQYTPSVSQYYLATWMAWDTMNPPPPSYFKVKLALLINTIANMLPGVIH